MKRFVIAIEETVVQEFTVDANSAEEAMKLTKRLYRKGEYVLEPGEVQFRQMAITKPNSEVTEWVKF